MSDGWKQRFEEEIEILKQGRDELKVQVHLGAADARDAWEQVERNWGHLEGRLKQIGQVGQESAEEIEEAAKNLVSEIKAGYKQLREIL